MASMMRDGCRRESLSWEADIDQVKKFIFLWAFMLIYNALYGDGGSCLRRLKWQGMGGVLSKAR